LLEGTDMVWSITCLILLAEAVIWFALVPLIVRPFGIKTPMLWHSLESYGPALRALSRWQYIVVEGGLKFGVGSWLLISTSDYVGWRFGYWRGLHQTVASLLFGMVAYLLMGFMVGLADWTRRHHHSAGAG